MNEIFCDFNMPYLITLMLLLFIGAIELSALLVGGAIFSHFDTAFDASVLAGGENIFSQGLNWLLVGRLPLLIIVVIFLGSFSLLGLTGQQLSLLLTATPLPSPIMFSLAFMLSLPVVHYGGRLLSRWFPPAESQTISEDDFIGCLAKVTGATACAGQPTECKLKDRYGQLHYVLVEPEPGSTLLRGEQVLIIERLSGSRFLAERNPWPGVLK